MRLITLICGLIVLTTCAVPGRGVMPRSPTGTAVSPLTTPRPLKQSTPLLTPTSSITSAVQPTATSTFASSVLVAVLNQGQNQNEIRAVDPNTGGSVPGYAPLTLGSDTQDYLAETFSSDRNQLAVVTYHGETCVPSGGGTSCWKSHGVLHLIDVRAWREVTATLPTEDQVWRFRFGPDAARLAVISGRYDNPTSSRLMVVDPLSGSVSAQTTLWLRPALMEYAQDGKNLVLFSMPLTSDADTTQPGPPRVLLLDATTLEASWDQPLADILSGSWCIENCNASLDAELFADWTPAVVISRDRHKLYIVHANEDKLTTLDLDTRTIHTVDLRSAKSWIEQFLELTAEVAEAKGAARGAYKTAVLSPDGNRLYVAGYALNAARDARGGWQSNQASTGLQIIDVESGRKIASREGEARQIELTPDGAYLLNHWGQAWTDLYDAKSLQRVARVDGWDVVPARRMSGEPILLASWNGTQNTRLGVLDTQVFEVMRSWSVDGNAVWFPAVTSIDQR